MPLFTELPNEIIWAVSELLDPPDLAALSRSCKSLNVSLHPVLYKHITVNRPIIHLLPLAYRIFSDPETAKLVRTFHCGETPHLDSIAIDSQASWRLMRERELTSRTGGTRVFRRGWPAKKNLEPLLWSKVSQLADPDDKEYLPLYQDVRHGRSLDVILLLMMLSLKKLESLSIAAPGSAFPGAEFPDNFKRLFHRAVERKSETSPWTVPEITFESHCNSDEPIDDTWAGFFTLRGLQTLRAKNIGIIPERNESLTPLLRGLKPGSSEIRELDMLGFCPLAEEAVVHLLSVCSQLSTFRFKIIVDCYEEPFDTDVLMYGLYERADTIETIDLRLGSDNGASSETQVMCSRMASTDFRRLGKLKNATIAFPLLLGPEFVYGRSIKRPEPEKPIFTQPDILAQRLPQSIETLTLDEIRSSGTAECLNAALHKLFGEMPQVFPNLRKLEISVETSALLKQFTEALESFDAEVAIRGGLEVTVSSQLVGMERGETLWTSASA